MSQAPVARIGARSVDRGSLAARSGIGRCRWNVRMTRVPSDPGPEPRDTPGPVSSATGCSVDCVAGSRGFGSGSGVLAALVQIHERNRFLRSVSAPYDYRRFGDFSAIGAFHVYLTKG